MDRRIVQAELEHVPAVAFNIRPDDARELMVAYDSDPYSIILQSFSISEKCWTAIVDGEPIAIFGVVMKGAGQGRPWMVGTTALDRHRLKFTKGCQAVIDEMLSVFPVLENVVDTRNKRNIRWLRWLGFEFGEIIFVGLQSLPFITFRMEKA
jgi:hypothetical protein